MFSVVHLFFFFLKAQFTAVLYDGSLTVLRCNSTDATPGKTSSTECTAQAVEVSELLQDGNSDLESVPSAGQRATGLCPLS